jgi:hypothetical protein
MLYTFVYPYDLEKYLTDKSLLSEEDRKFIETMDEDQNPVLLKYYLK